MIRTKITAYLTPDLADALKRVAAIKDRSLSDIVEDAVARTFADASREAEHAAVMARLGAISRQLGAIEKAQETHFELTSHAARFAMCVAPDIADQDRPLFNRRGAERFHNVVATVVARLAGGRSVWREHFPTSEALPPSSARAAE